MGNVGVHRQPAAATIRIRFEMRIADFLEKDRRQMTSIPCAASAINISEVRHIVLKLWNEAVAAGGMVTPGLGTLVNSTRRNRASPVTVTDEHGVSTEYADSLRSLYEQRQPGNSGDLLDKGWKPNGILVRFLINGGACDVG